MLFGEARSWRVSSRPIPRDALQAATFVHFVNSIVIYNEETHPVMSQEAVSIWTMVSVRGDEDGGTGEVRIVGSFSQ